MLLQEPPQTQYDLHFRCLGFPVRISVWFWVAISILGYSGVRSLDGHLGPSSPGMLPLLLLWVLCVLVSILIHELGHTLAYRKYGIEASIVLYHLGGLAIPRSRNPYAYDPAEAYSRSLSGGSSGDLTSKQRIFISLAGPFLQMAVAIVVMVIVKATGHGFQLSLDGYLYTPPLGPIGWIPGLLDGEPITSPGLYVLLDFFLVPSLLWALLNLVPVWPLDGGQVMSNVLTIYRQPNDVAYKVSLVTALGIAFYAFLRGDTYLCVMFLVLAFSSYQLLQQTSLGGY